MEKLERLFRGISITRKHKYYKKELKIDILTVKKAVFKIKSRNSQNLTVTETLVQEQ